MKQRTKKRTPDKKWVKRVMQTSNALDLPKGIFTGSAKTIARQLQDSAIKSTRRKAEPYRSALSMLIFHINRSGKSLAPGRRRELEQAKVELKKLFKRD